MNFWTHSTLHCNVICSWTESNNGPILWYLLGAFKSEWISFDVCEPHIIAWNTKIMTHYSEIVA